MTSAPLVFLSYVHDDDEASNGFITRLREQLEREVRVRLGDKHFAIFQDRKDIKWGEQWKKRLAEGVGDSTVFIPVITPSYFASDACRVELTQFLEHEKALGRDDLIMPILFLPTEDLSETSPDALKAAVAAHQWLDWQRLRRESQMGPAYLNAQDEAAERLRVVLRRSGPPPSPPKPGKTAVQAGASPSPPMVQEALAPAIAEPLLIVDAMGRGNHTSLAAAITKAVPGTRILVRPGHYREALVIDKALEIIGDAPLGEVVIAIKDKPVVTSRAAMARIANLTLHQLGGDVYGGVHVQEGRIDIEDCDIVSHGNAGIVISNHATPSIRRNRIHDGASAGILVSAGGRGIIEDNDIAANALAGIEIKDGSDPQVRRNRIHGGRQSGIFIHGKGRGVVEDNEIAGNIFAGIEIMEEGEPQIRRNRIQSGKTDGISVHDNGRGVIEDNEITGNGTNGIIVKENSLPEVRGNRIHGNQFGCAVFNSAGNFRDNDLTGNTHGALWSDEDSAKRITRVNNKE